MRERGEDIPTLAVLFARQAARRLGHASPHSGAKVAVQLEANDWPGNVRELQNAVERAVILAGGGVLHFDLDLAKTKSPRPAALESSAERQGSDEVPETREEMRQRERKNLSAALAKVGGKISGPGGAAEMLGMKPTTLASRMRVLGLTASGARQGGPRYR